LERAESFAVRLKKVPEQEICKHRNPYVFWHLGENGKICIISECLELVMLPKIVKMVFYRFLDFWVYGLIMIKLLNYSEELG
jgi:hypothetical protein